MMTGIIGPVWKTPLLSLDGTVLPNLYIKYICNIYVHIYLRECV